MKPIDKPSVTVVKNFPMPPEGVKNVVKATVILLGMSPEEAKRWQAVKKALSKGGTEAIDRRSAALDVNTVSVESAQAAQALMKDVSEKMITQQSRAAFDFYEWNKAVIEAVMAR